MRPAWLSFWAFAAVLGPRSILGQSITPGIVPGTVPCDNDLDDEVRFNVSEQGITISRPCWWVASNQDICAFVDVNEDVLVAVTCANQCPALSGCPFVAPPTPSPTPIPTLSPTSLPTPSPTRAPTPPPSPRPVQPPPPSAPTPPDEPVVPDTAMPTAVPVDLPSMMPSEIPSFVPTAVLSRAPSAMPSVIETESPTSVPSSPVTETAKPTTVPEAPEATEQPTPEFQTTEPPSSEPVGDTQTSEPSGGAKTQEPTRAQTIDPTGSPQTPEPTGATQTAAPTSQSTSEPTTASPAELLPTGVPEETVAPVPVAPSPAPVTEEPVLTSPTPVPMTTETTLQGLSTTYINVDLLTQGEVAQLLKLTETWWNAYYPPGSSCNFQTIMEFVDQRVSFNSDGLPENLVVFNQRLIITTPVGGEVGFSPPGSEIATNGPQDTCPVEDASTLPPERIAVLPYEDFVANTQLGLIYREKIASFADVKIPLQIPNVPGGMPEVDTSGSKAILCAGIAVILLQIGLFA